ncbi:MAG: hypothetical protein Tsb008_13680 [Rhodothalassiaceae bacterium]
MMNEPGSVAGKSRALSLMWGAICALIAVPFIAMQVTDEVDWNGADFAVLTSLLVGGGGAFSAIARRQHEPAYLWATGIAILAAILLFLVTGAVGIIGAETHDANLLYMVILALFPVGALLCRLRAAAMAWLVLGIGVLQLAIGVLALIAGWGEEAAAWPWDILSATGVFCALWLVSAMLFRRAGRT